VDHLRYGVDMSGVMQLFAAGGSSGSATTDPYWANVSLLLHGDGTNGSTTITDSAPTPKTVTAVGNAQISTAQSKFGGSSLYFDGTGDYLSVPDSTDFDFFLGDFTIEAWVYAVSLANSPIIVHQCSANSGLVIGWFLEIGANTVYFGNSNSIGTDYATFTVSLTTNTWTLIAVTRVGAVLNCFINGVSPGAQTKPTAVNNADQTVPFIVGGGGTIFSGLDFNGYIDDLRVTKGVARYTADFAPPTLAFPDGSPALTYATLNPADKHANITLSNGDLTCTSAVAGYTAVRATQGKSTGKWYWEIHADNLTAGILVGIGNGSMTLNNYVGGDANGIGYNSFNGNKYNSTNATYGSSWSTGNTIGIALDMTNGRIFFSVNGTWQNSGDPVAGTGFAYSGLTGTMYPACSAYNGTILTANFGATAFSYTPPTGYASGVY
jgi:hypothetical protein